MKEYVNTFLHYRFLLGELVKKGIKLKYRRSYLGIVWSLLEPLLTMIVLTIVFGTLFGNKDPCIYSYRSFAVQLFFKFNVTCAEISQSECGNDQKSICTEVYLSIIQCTL